MRLRLEWLAGILAVLIVALAAVLVVLWLTIRGGDEEATPVPDPTVVPTVTAVVATVFTATATFTPSATSAPEATETLAPTSTLVPTPTQVPTASSTATPVPTHTPEPTPTQVPSPTVEPTATPMPTPVPAPTEVATGGCGDAERLVSDCETLLDLRDELAGDAELNWSIDRPVDEWDGIELDSDRLRIASLVLDERGLTGDIPAGLGELTGLEVCRLRGTV